MEDDSKPSKGAHAKQQHKSTALPSCGIVMPISATASHEEPHWRQVQSLIHRAVIKAGFTPVNVWEGDLNDRISERIIENLFRLDIVVVDISDQNSNVMIELGLRLASKKPTIVITNDPKLIPFDIKDFHAVPYPKDLRIIETEQFLDDLSSVLISKHELFNNGDYKSFLKDVVIEVVTPEIRETSAQDAILSTLSDITNRLSRIENNVFRDPDVAFNWFSSGKNSKYPPYSYGVELRNVTPILVARFVSTLNMEGQTLAKVVSRAADLTVIRVDPLADTSPKEMLSVVRGALNKAGIDSSRSRIIANA